MSKPCLFDLHKDCVVFDKLDQSLKNEFGTVTFIKTVCSMCIKVWIQKKRETTGRIGVGVTL